MAKTATDGATAAQPFLASLWTFITTTQPVLLVEYGLGAYAFYLLSPLLLGGLFGGLRGYAGDLSAVQVRVFGGGGGGKGGLRGYAGDLSAVQVRVRAIVYARGGGGLRPPPAARPCR